jgi:hypothetical protein
MKKNICIFLSMAIIAMSSSAQDCTEVSLLEKTGIWKEGMKGSITGIPADDLAKEKKVVASLHNMIKSNFKPLGVTAEISEAYDRSYPDMPVNHYSFNVLFLPYYCEGNIIKTANETSTSFFINANKFDAEIFDKYDENNTSGEGYHSMPSIPVEKNGCYYFEADASLGFGMAGKSYTWLITYDGKLPYSYVSKKEFLEKRKLLLLKALPEALTALKEIMKLKDMEKSMTEVQYKNDPEKLKRYMNNDYLPVKEVNEKNLVRTEKDYKNAIAKIETQLKMSPDDLNQTAIVKIDPQDPLSYLFTDDNDAFGRVLIQPNPGYFNKKLSRSTPQFFTVNVSGNQNNKIAANAMADIMKAVDFSILKNLLGK